MGKKKQKSVVIRDLNAQMVRPGCDAPISIQAVYERLRDHGIAPHKAIVEGRERACVTEQEAKAVLAQFETDHAKRRRRLGLA